MDVYAFHWFHNDAGDWLIGVWNDDDSPSRPEWSDLPQSLTVQHISARDNPTGSMKPVRAFCQQFMSDTPFRVRAIRNKIPTLRTLEASDLLHGGES